MRLEATKIAGVYVVHLERARDERGWFVRTYDEDIFAAAGLCTAFPQHGESRNLRRGILRGLHLQSDPHAEAKLIRCTRGAVFDVLADVRPGSPTRGRALAFELDEEMPKALYAAPGIAHGYQVLRDESFVEYLLSARYVAEAAQGFRYDSPAFDIEWPIRNPLVGARDRALPPFS